MIISNIIIQFIILIKKYTHFNNSISLLEYNTYKDIISLCVAIMYTDYELTLYIDRKFYVNFSYIIILQLISVGDR